LKDSTTASTATRKITDIAAAKGLEILLHLMALLAVVLLLAPTVIVLVVSFTDGLSLRVAAGEPPERVEGQHHGQHRDEEDHRHRRREGPVLAVVLLLAPTVIVLVVSFTDGLSLRFPPPGYSLRWRRAERRGERATASAASTPSPMAMRVASTATVRLFPDVLLAGRLAGLGLHAGSGSHGGLRALRGAQHRVSRRRAERRGERATASAASTPSPMAMRVASTATVSLVGWPVSVFTLVLGHTVVCVPYVVRNTV
jgi:ABC-type spermidine/putrescine transport system permease subunit II